MNKFYVYILASKKNGTLYIGATDDLERRVLEHKSKIEGSFTARYNVNLLVYFEEYETGEAAFTRERQMKKWNRAWKLKLIEKDNLNWEDLSKEWYE
jgi:putative endonuclease